MGSLIDILILCQSLILRSMRMMEMIPKYNLTLLAFDNTTLATIKAEYKQVRGKYFRSVVTCTSRFGAVATLHQHWPCL